MYISYSGFKKLKACAFSYWHEYVNKTEVVGPDDRLGSIYGSTVGRIFERFYNDKAWKSDQPQALVMGWVDETLNQVIKDETTPSRYRKGGVLLWKGMEGSTARAYENREQIAADVRDSVARGFRIIRQQRLLGPRAEAEVKLDQDIEGHRVGGRADFVIHRTRPHGDLTITDGKGSTHRDKYVDPQQLIWYSALLKRKEGTLPDRVGFIFWRFEVNEAVDWYEVTQAEVDDLTQLIVSTLDKVEKDKATLGSETALDAVAQLFPKSPSEQACRFCPYATQDICPEGAAFAEKAAKKSAKGRPRKV